MSSSRRFARCVRSVVCLFLSSVPGGAFAQTAAAPPAASLTIRDTVLNESYYASPDPRWVYAPGRTAHLTTVLTF